MFCYQVDCFLLTHNYTEYYENLDLETIVTPVDVEKFIRQLEQHNYDSGATDFLRDSFCNGFDIKYNGPQVRRSQADNLPFTVGNDTILWNKLMKEVKLKRVAGPFKQVPFDNFI